MEEVKEDRRQKNTEVLPPFRGNSELIWQDTHTFTQIAAANDGFKGFILDRMSANKQWHTVRPLHVAAAYGADNWVKALLQKRADPDSVMTTCYENEVDQDHFTPLELACAYGHWPCAISLLAHRAKPINLQCVPENYLTEMHYVFAEINLPLFNKVEPSHSQRLIHQIYLATLDCLKLDEEYQVGIGLLAKLASATEFANQVVLLSQHFNRPITTLMGKSVLTPMKDLSFDTRLLNRIHSDQRLHWQLGIKHNAYYYDLATPTGRCMLRYNIMQSHLVKEAILPIQQWRVDLDAVYNNTLLNHNTDDMPNSDSDFEPIEYNY